MRHPQKSPESLPELLKLKVNSSTGSRPRYTAVCSVHIRCAHAIVTMGLANDKLSRLAKLNETLKPPQALGGVFLPDDSLKQFDFMFIAEMPSRNIPKNWDGKSNYNFNVTARDRFFQKLMVNYGVAGSYATDVVKAINIPRRPTKEEMKEWLPFLCKEIAIIQPKNIVVIGETTYFNSFKPLVQPHISGGIKIDWVYHYSQQGSKTNTEVEQRFADVINRMRNSE